MKRLIESHLFGGGLVPVNTEILVTRYNACLEAIGQTPTKLSSFSIDAVGWSPEVANEKGDVEYLSLGFANRFAIILTPDQNGLPVYRPSHSFDRIAIESVFRVAYNQIADLTSQTGLWLDFSHEISRFNSPLDLLSVEWMNIRLMDTSGIMDAAKMQRSMVTEFLENDVLCLDRAFQEKILKSARDFGDLRFRSILLPEIKFVDLRWFYTRAYEGVYVFRDTPERGQFLIMEDEKLAPTAAAKNGVPIYSISDGGLIDVLEKEDIVDVPLGWYKQRAGLEYLSEILSYLLAQAFYETGENRDFKTLNSAQRKKWISLNESRMNPSFYEVEKLHLDLKRGIPVKELEMSSKLRTLLLQPSKSSQESEVKKRVVWQLIARLAPVDVERLFVRNKAWFYDLYKTWSFSQAAVGR